MNNKTRCHHLGFVALDALDRKLALKKSRKNWPREIERAAPSAANVVLEVGEVDDTLVGDVALPPVLGAD